LKQVERNKKVLLKILANRIMNVNNNDLHLIYKYEDYYVAKFYSCLVCLLYLVWLKPKANFFKKFTANAN